MTAASDEKRRPFNCLFSRVGLRTYQNPSIFLEFLIFIPKFEKHRTITQLFLMTLNRDISLITVKILSLPVPVIQQDATSK